MPVIMGLFPVKNGKAALSIAREVPGIKLSPQIEELAKKDPAANLTEFFLDHAISVAQANMNLVRGFHVVGGVTPFLALKLMRRLVERFKHDRAA